MHVTNASQRKTNEHIGSMSNNKIYIRWWSKIVRVGEQSRMALLRWVVPCVQQWCWILWKYDGLNICFSPTVSFIHIQFSMYHPCILPVKQTKLHVFSIPLERNREYMEFGLFITQTGIMNTKQFAEFKFVGFGSSSWCGTLRYGYTLILQPRTDSQVYYYDCVWIVPTEAVFGLIANTSNIGIFFLLLGWYVNTKLGTLNAPPPSLANLCSVMSKTYKNEIYARIMDIDNHKLLSILFCKETPRMIIPVLLTFFKTFLVLVL